MANTNSQESDANGAGKNPAQVALELYDVLFPHPSDVRQKAVQAVMMSLGENVPSLAPVEPLLNRLPGGADEFADIKLGPRAKKWIQKQGLTRMMLDEVFHFGNDGAAITASTVPGVSKRDMTINCYLLLGARGLLKSDTPSLQESETVALCKRLTAYDKNNHTTHRKAVGNRMHGDKPEFTLTGPGETAAADLIKQMAA